MIKKLLSLFAAGTMSAAPPAVPEVKLDASKIYPYVVPSGYFDAAVDTARSRSVTWTLGHGLQVALVHDLDGLVRNVHPEDLTALGLTLTEAKVTAIHNLEVLARSGAIGFGRFDSGPRGRPFLLFGGHWAAATCILLPGLREMGVKNLESDEICVSIPHREALLMFAKGDREYRDAMRAMIVERESDGRKPLTFCIFELSASGINELSE